MIGLGTCPEFCDDMLQLKRYATDLREVGCEEDKNILIFGLDFSALDPMIGVAKICRERQGKETRSVKFVCVYLTGSIKGC